MGTDQLEALNRPRTLVVRADRHGLPQTITLRRRRHAVRTVIDRWLVETRWWRPPETRRLYFQVELDDGSDLVLYHDLTEQTWWTHKG